MWLSLSPLNRCSEDFPSHDKPRVFRVRGYTADETEVVPLTAMWGPEEQEEILSGRVREGMHRGRLVLVEVRCVDGGLFPPLTH